MSVWAGLIERLEKATGPDRELDGAISDAVGVVWLECCGHPVVCNGPDPYEECCGEPVEIKPLPYTSSLDAALTLVPEGWRRQIFEHVTGGWSARVIGPGFVTVAPFESDENPLERLAPNGALALCIASITARQVIDTLAHGVDEPG